MQTTSSASWPELAILDVGHGNSTLVCDADHVIVIDAPQGTSVLLEALEWRGITDVHTVLISHSDSDHAGGLLTLLTDPDINVRAVYFNPDALRDTDVWETLQVAVRDARRDQNAFSTRSSLRRSQVSSTPRGSRSRCWRQRRRWR